MLNISVTLILFESYTLKYKHITQEQVSYDSASFSGGLSFEISSFGLCGLHVENTTLIPLKIIEVV